jgi:hypothetical protein
MTGSNGPSKPMATISSALRRRLSNVQHPKRPRDPHQMTMACKAGNGHQWESESLWRLHGVFTDANQLQTFIHVLGAARQAMCLTKSPRVLLHGGTSQINKTGAAPAEALRARCKWPKL